VDGLVTGSCHCGNVRVELQTARSPADFQVRACQCSFCTRHGVRSISDPNGHLVIHVADESDLLRYRFGLRTADFLICTRCGVYIGAMFVDGDRGLAVLNANVLDERAAFGAPEPFSYDGETAESRQARRRSRWMPATISFA
jgi:hypothetical protein